MHTGPQFSMHLMHDRYLSFRYLLVPLYLSAVGSSDVSHPFFPQTLKKNCTFLYYLREKYKIKLIVRKPNLECLIQISLVVYGSNTHLGVQVQQKPQRRSGPLGIHVTMKEHHDFQNHPILTFLHYLYLCLPSRSSFYSLSLSLLLC